MSKNTQTSGLVNYITHSGSIVSVSGSLTVTGSLNVTGGMTGSFQGVATTASYVLNAVSSSFATTASYAVSASIATNAVTASHALNAVSASFATTAVTSSFANAFTVAGTLTATTLVVQTITSSVDFVTGSTRFGSLLANTHAFTGSVGMTGSLAVAGNVGVGTSSTVGKLDINTGGNSNIVISNDSTDTGYNIVSLNGTRTKGSYAGIAGGGTADNNLYLNSGGSVIVQTSSSYTPRLTISNTGAATFSIASGIYTAVNITSPNTSVYYKLTPTGGDAYYLGAGVQQTDDFAIYNVTRSKNYLTILGGASGGNVGIGTTSPSDLLEIKTTSANQANVRLYNTFNSGASSNGLVWFRDYDAATNAIGAYIYYARTGGSAGDMTFGTGTNSSVAERMRILSNGRVGIGTTNPADIFVVSNSGAEGIEFGFDTGIPYLFGYNRSTSAYKPIAFVGSGNVIITTGTIVDAGYKLDINSSSTYKTLMLRANAIGTRFDTALEFNAINVLTSPYARIGLQVSSASSGAETGGLTFWTINSGTLSEKMCITSDGNVLVGRTTSGLNNTSGTTIAGGSIQVEEASYVFYGNRTTSDGTFIGIRRNNVDVGSISVTTSATAFNTSSDYRLKTDFKEFNALSIIDSITTYDFAWKIDNTRAYGVKAHELQNILPYVVFGEKDAINEDDSIKPQAVDYSKLVPVLVKAIQELQTRITQLENK